MKFKFNKFKKLRKYFSNIPQYFLILFNFLTFIFFSIYLFNLQLEKINILAEEGLNFKKSIPAPRGNIYATDKYGNLYPLANNSLYYKVYFKNFKNLQPQELEKIYNEIKKVFEPKVKLEKFLNSKNELLFLGEINLVKRDEIKKLNIDSLWLEQNYRRVYPYGELVSKIVGFTQDFRGIYGLEASYDDILMGNDGILVNGKIFKVPEPGNDLITTIDINVQKKVYEATKKFLEEFKAKEAVSIVMESKSGKIIALVEIPSYDNNKINLVKDYSLFELKSLTPYEPGSVIKPFLFALGIEENKITPETVYEDKGVVFVDGYKIYNWDKKAHGKTDIQTALNKSLNLAAIFIENQVGDNKFLEMLERIKIEETTGIDILNEKVGSLKSLKKPYGRKVNFYTASFGQGITMTPLRLLVDFNIFANEGFIVRPFLVQKIRKNTNQKIFESIIARPFSKETIEKINLMLQKVVEEGLGKRAKMENYFVAGKTGTAISYDPEIKSYNENKLIHTFVGYFPATRPQFTILTLFKEPIGGLTASQTTTKLWKEIASFLVSYYGIPPDKY